MNKSKTLSYYEWMRGQGKTQGNTVDFREFLAKDNPSTFELYNAYSASTQWVTCACGQQDKDIPRDGKGVPIDNRLETLGRAFTLCLQGMRDAWESFDMESYRSNRAEAQKVLGRIQERSAQLLAELN